MHKHQLLTLDLQIDGFIWELYEKQVSFGRRKSLLTSRTSQKQTKSIHKRKLETEKEIWKQILCFLIL